jgi:hypothetical protein
MSLKGTGNVTRNARKQARDTEGGRGVTDEHTAVWNRAAFERGGRTPRGGDAALGALLAAHRLVTNGGVLHAARALGTPELQGACDGYRFFGFDDVAELLERAVDATEMRGTAQRLNAEYARSIPNDEVIVGGFARHFNEHREFYAPA